MALRGIDLIWIVANDFEAAIELYTKGLGMKLLERNDEFGWAELAGPEGARLGIAQHGEYSEIQPGQNAVVALTVDNLEAAIQPLIQAGGRLVGKIQEIPGHVRLQTFQDAAGNTLQLCQKLG